MSETTVMSEAPPAGAMAHFASRRLMSLFGVLPLGTFLVYHFYFHSFSHGGAAVYDPRIAWLYSSPFHVVIACVTVYIPLAWHAVVGTLVTLKSRPNMLQFTFFRNWMYTLQRASAIGLALFIPAHLVKARFAKVFWPEASISWGHMHDAFVNPGVAGLLTRSVYVLGILGAAFHLANGLWGFAVDWGILVGPRAQKVGSWVAVAVFLCLAAMGFWAMAGFMTQA
jgi:succinate dehydrogenase / fumarate reductase, cytochrome b subunit